MKKQLFITLSFVFCITTLIFLKKYFFKNWAHYYQEKLYKGPRPLLVKALSLCDQHNEKTKNALDIGAGAGNDTVFLLEHNFRVWAIDNEKIACDIIAARHDITPYKDNLSVVHQSIVDIPWQSLPPYHLIYAGYSLPFVSPTDFANVWQNITQGLVRGGMFIGNFFGHTHAGFNSWEKRGMTFLTKEQLDHLLKDFTVELLEETCTRNEKGIMDHSFNVIAIKK